MEGGELPRESPPCCLLRVDGHAMCGTLTYETDVLKTTPSYRTTGGLIKMNIASISSILWHIRILGRERSGCPRGRLALFRDPGIGYMRGGGLPWRLLPCMQRLQLPSGVLVWLTLEGRIVETDAIQRATNSL